LAQQTLEGSFLRESIIEQGYGLVSHSIPDNVIYEAIEAYDTLTTNYPDPEYSTMDQMITDPLKLDVLDFTKDKQKEWNRYRTNHKQLAKPGGYTSRSLQVATLQHSGRDLMPDGSRIEDDPKEYYHFHPGGILDIERNHKEFGWGSVPPEVGILQLKGTLLHKMARSAIAASFKLLEEGNPELINTLVKPSDLMSSPVRLNWYHLDQAEFLAGYHQDKGVFTMQIAESHMGLRVRSPTTNKMEIVNRHGDMAVVFPGIAWDDNFKDSPLRPAPHDVINMPDLNPDRYLRARNCARWSLIFFTNVPGCEFIQKSDTHGVFI
jgi:hypothetical protein